MIKQEQTRRFIMRLSLCKIWVETHPGQLIPRWLMPRSGKSIRLDIWNFLATQKTKALAVFEIISPL